MKAAPGFKKLTIATLLANMFILVGVGNATGFLLIAEIILPGTINNVKFTLNGDYDSLLATAALLSFCGQLFYAGSMFIPKYSHRIVVIGAGMLFTYTGIFYLTDNFSSDNFSIMALITAVPFVCLSLVLLYNMASRYPLSVVHVRSSVRNTDESDYIHQKQLSPYEHENIPS